MPLCLWCRKPVKVAPYKKAHRYHYACLRAKEAQLRARILNAPETEVTDEDVRQFFAPTLTPFELQRKEEMRG